MWHANVHSSVKGICNKLQPAYIGPYVITERRNDRNYMAQVGPKDGKVKPVHHDKLLKYNGRNPPSWAVKLSKELTTESETRNAKI